MIGSSAWPARERAGALILCVLLSACAAPPLQEQVADWGACEFPDLKIETDFAGGRASGCRRPGEHVVEIRISPENLPVNPSPWYAFRVSARSPQRIEVVLRYDTSRHRYHPKVSRDGHEWRDLEPQRVEVLADGSAVRMQLDPGDQPLWVAAQELWTNAKYGDWLRAIERKPFVRVRRLGFSREHRPIPMLESRCSERCRSVIVLIGRQHPPEVTGAYALRAFSEALLGDSEQARRFRRSHQIIVVPNLNPDGVAHGNWRHNTGGVDLNRDWGPFTQPETQLMRDLLAKLAADPSPKLELVLDFHSTWRDLMYTQSDDEPTDPPDVARQWLQRLSERLPDYRFERDSTNTGVPSARTYVYRTYGISSITYEVGDATPRDRIAVIAQEAAIALMATLDPG